MKLCAITAFAESRTARFCSFVSLFGIHATEFLNNTVFRYDQFGMWQDSRIPHGTSGDPKNQGCETFYGYNCQLLAHSYYPDHLWDNDQRVELKDNVLEVQYGKGTYSQDLIHSKALDYLDNLEEDEPFFMWYPTILPHAELIVPEDAVISVECFTTLVFRIARSTDIT